MASESKAEAGDGAASKPAPSMEIVSSDVSADGGSGESKSAAATSDVFSFTFNPDPALPCVTDRDFKDNLKKWYACYCILCDARAFD
jgi:hypothetical protein